MRNFKGKALEFYNKALGLRLRESEANEIAHYYISGIDSFQECCSMVAESWLDWELISYNETEKTEYIVSTELSQFINFLVDAEVFDPCGHEYQTWKFLDNVSVCSV
jgi:hypothetical protein